MERNANRPGALPPVTVAERLRLGPGTVSVLTRAASSGTATFKSTRR